MKERINKINQLAEELTTLRELLKETEEEKNGINNKIRQYQIELEAAGKRKIDYAMPTEAIVEQQNQEKERLTQLIFDAESSRSIIADKDNSICVEIMEVKNQLSKARGQYMNACEQKLLSDSAFKKVLKIIAECVDAGYVVNEGFFNKESFIDGLFKNLPDVDSTHDLKIKDEVRSDVVLGLGRY